MDNKQHPTCAGTWRIFSRAWSERDREHSVASVPSCCENLEKSCVNNICSTCAFSPAIWQNMSISHLWKLNCRSLVVSSYVHVRVWNLYLVTRTWCFPHSQLFSLTWVTFYMRIKLSLNNLNKLKFSLLFLFLACTILLTY